MGTNVPYADRTLIHSGRIAGSAKKARRTQQVRAAPDQCLPNLEGTGSLARGAALARVVACERGLTACMVTVAMRSRDGQYSLKS